MYCLPILLNSVHNFLLEMLSHSAKLIYLLPPPQHTQQNKNIIFMHYSPSLLVTGKSLPSKKSSLRKKCLLFFSLDTTFPGLDPNSYGHHFNASVRLICNKFERFRLLMRSLKRPISVPNNSEALPASIYMR